MGRLMAGNCVAAGFDVTVWNRSAGKAREFADVHDSRMAATPVELAAGADMVVSMLADDASVRSVYLGRGGLIAASGAALLVEMGTISPSLADELARAAQQHGKAFVDAPVSGSTAAAETAQLLIMAGCGEGEHSGLDAVFSAMGRRTAWLGAAGAGAVMKLAVNLLIHGLNQTLAEALTLAERAGIEETLAFDLFQESAAGAPMLRYRRPLYLDEANHPVSFTVDLAAKDVALARELADGLGVAMPQAEITHEVLRDAIADGYGGRDMASILTYMKEKTR